jgi:predicted nucleotidyltransferase
MATIVAMWLLLSHGVAVDLHNPLAVIAPTLDAAVLQGLAATTSWTTGRGVHRLIDKQKSQDGVRKALHRLAAQGIVEAEQHPQATLYRLNREHVAADLILGLTRLRQAIIDRIVEHLGMWEAQPLHASLFGSFARNEARANSDIDVLVVIPSAMDEAVRARQVVELAQAIERWTGNRAQIVDITPQQVFQMIEANDPLVMSWRADAVRLTGSPLLDLLRSVRLSQGRLA